VKSLLFILLPQGYRSQQGTFRLQVAGQPVQQVWFEEIRLWEQKPQEWWPHHPGLMSLFPLCDHGLQPQDALTHAAEQIRGRVMDAARREDLMTTLGFFAKLADKDLNVASILGRNHMRESPFYQEIVAEGKLEGVREALHTAIKTRYGEDALAEFEPKISTINDLEQLQALNTLAWTKRITQFRKALGQTS
jgi:predicted transposase YdaD